VKIFDAESRNVRMHRLIAMMPTVAAFASRQSIGMRYAYPENELSCTGNVLSRTIKKTVRPPT
jgi:citrate synthase